ncbi:Hypothetical predicted protein [Marmota monax]|uniref:Abnormal spindle-like microcephaly-associated protein ASH domain-containing protein n=1 Tax=Marmota monax TaxID=9995 RepID=A0A5E4BBH6_MARMO|nr:Hypothetical predicted protein [Marmota monax]
MKQSGGLKPVGADRAQCRAELLGRPRAAVQVVGSVSSTGVLVQAVPEPRPPAGPSASRDALWHIEIQKGRLQALRKSHHEEAEARGRSLQVHEAQQLFKEKEALEKADKNQQLRVRKSLQVQKGLGLRHQTLVEEAQRNHKVAVKFLKASLGRVRERERGEESETREHLRQRMDAVLALKNSIAASRETLRRVQAWGRARAALTERKAKAEKEAILAQGGDAFRHLVHQQRRQHLEAQRRTFQEGQELRKQEIVGRIVKEVAEEGNRKKKQRLPARAPRGRTLRDRTWSYIAHVCTGETAVASSYPLEVKAAAHPEPSWLLKADSSESVQGVAGATSGEQETLAEPEIPGLWREDYMPYQEHKEDVNQKPVGGTKMDKDILARTMAQLRRGVVHKQVALGREFKGCPFNSKPQLVHFQDFEVGKAYKKKITLVNATYTINYCSLVGVSEDLRDFIHVSFDPPGPLSAGMSCEVLVTFKPMVSLDKELISFGSYVVGETTSRTITLTNTGGLGTSFKFLPASEVYETDEESLPLLKMSSLFTYDDKGPTSVSEQQLEGNGTSPLDTQSRKESDKMEEQEGTSATGGLGMFPSEQQAEITLGEITEGEIGPFSSIRVPIMFTPVTPGEVQTKFKVMFKNPKCPTLYFRATGVALDVPVWVPKPNVDLKICMYDRLYQDSVPIYTRSKVALRLKFEVCRELRGHMELLPEMGYIQAQSSYSVQLKFLPRHSLPEDAGKYFDKESRVLEAPMTIWVADQIKPVGFTVQAIVTTSDLELSPSELDFGHCTIYEAIRAEIVLYNHSLLPQEFGFVGLPKPCALTPTLHVGPHAPTLLTCTVFTVELVSSISQFVDIQPNDGFGTVLPLEALQLDVVFQPTKAREYSFQLVCKSEVNRCFKLSCRAVGVHPPLELSHYQIKFAATSLYDTSVARLYVINSHTGASSLPRSGPRVSSEEASPVGATSFEFLLPSDLPITISPLVGTVLPGKRCLVQVAFRPVLSHEVIHEEALQILNKEIQNKLFRKDTFSQKKELWRQSLSVLRLRTRERMLQAVASQAPQQEKQELRVSSHEYQIAQSALVRTFQAKFDKFVVPCVMASGDVKDRKGSEPLSFSPHNTLYLELWCPAVAPSIVVTSNKGKTTFNFGDIAVGHRGIKKISLQNICPEDLAVEFSVLNPCGPFALLNPFSKLCSGETQVLMLSFSPRESILAQETLDIISKKGTLTLTLTGLGVASMVSCSIEGHVLSMGYVLARESISSSFKKSQLVGEPVEAQAVPSSCLSAAALLSRGRGALASAKAEVVPSCALCLGASAWSALPPLSCFGGPDSCCPSEVCPSLGLKQLERTSASQTAQVGSREHSQGGSPVQKELAGAVRAGKRQGRVCGQLKRSSAFRTEGSTELVTWLDRKVGHRLGKELRRDGGGTHSPKHWLETQPGGTGRCSHLVPGGVQLQVTRLQALTTGRGQARCGPVSDTRPSWQLQNDSSLPIKFSMRLESLSSTRALARQQLPQFLASPTQRTDLVGEPLGPGGERDRGEHRALGVRELWAGRVAGLGDSVSGEGLVCRGARARWGVRWGGAEAASGVQAAGLGTSSARPAGPQNHNGQSVFSVVPVEGVMEPGKAQDFTVTFSPDHESLYFSDRLQVVLFGKVLQGTAPPPPGICPSLTLPCASHFPGQGHHIGGHQKISHQILLQGAAREHMMFVEGGDPLDVPVESLTVTSALDPEHREDVEELKPILLTLDYVQFDTDTPAPPATRELQVGCIRTTQPSPKKMVEFSLDSVPWLQHKGFSIEPSKGIVERGQTKTISISWVPPTDFDPDHPLMVSALLQLKGDVKETYKVIFVANVVTGP